MKYYSFIIIFLISSMVSGCSKLNAMGESHGTIEVLGEATPVLVVPTEQPCFLIKANDLAKGEGKKCDTNSYALALWKDKRAPTVVVLEITANSANALNNAINRVQAACQIQIPVEYFPQNATGMFTGQLVWKQAGCYDNFN